LCDAIQRYNLFAGGGCLPPRWGLGIWYRVNLTFTQQQTVDTALNLRKDMMPCDVIGLEPGWQSHAYPCSHTWNQSFPQPQEMVNDLNNLNYRVNLWAHVFTHASSPIYEALFPYSGSFQVLGGLVPDLLLPEARKVLADHFTREHVDLGVSGYKIDECDNTDYNPNYWSFPESTER
jgi:alpha-D-xyloside xylohydrolase